MTLRYAEPESRDRSSTFPSRAALLIAGTVVFVVGTIVFWLTAFPTVTWWGSCTYSLAAVTFGVDLPPGSLLLTILGWLVTHIPAGGAPAYVLNLTAGVLAALTSVMVYWLTLRVIGISGAAARFPTDRIGRLLPVIGAVVAALAFAFGQTLWLYAIKFTPYVLTALFTTFIIGAMLRWWQAADSDASYRWLFVIMLLFGLDFSVHRTNLLMFPGLLLWILLRHPKALGHLKTWLCGCVGLVLGLAVHLLIIPMAARQPYLNSNDPSSLSRFWNYISLKQYGGGWLINLYPRKADFFSEQVMDYVHDFAANFCWTTGLDSIPGGLLLALGLFGWLVLWRTNRRLATGLTGLFLLTSAGAVVYFNMPAGFFRSMDRHYLPSFVIFALWIGLGMASLSIVVKTLPTRGRTWAVGVLAGLMVLLVTLQLRHNYRTVDGSENYFCFDAAHNHFDTLPEGAILFTSGDNDTTPLWYFQGAEGVRPDVTICNVGLLNTTWFTAQLMTRDRDFPLTLPHDSLSQLKVLTWRDSLIAIEVLGSSDGFNLPDSVLPPDTCYMRTFATPDEKFMLIQDQLILRIIQDNQWRRPLYFTAPPRWLQMYCRPEGLAYRLLPVESAPLNTDILRENLLNRYRYRGYADSSVPMEQATKWAGGTLYRPFLMLAMDELGRGDTSACLELKQTMLQLLPLERLEPHPQIRALIDRMCLESDANGS